MLWPAYCDLISLIWSVESDAHLLDQFYYNGDDDYDDGDDYGCSYCDGGDDCGDGHDDDYRSGGGDD